MATQNFPTEFVGEYQGADPGGSFVNGQGEQVVYGELLKVLRRTNGGTSSEMYEVRVSPDVELKVDTAALKIGDKIKVAGDVALPERRPGWFKALLVDKAPAGSAA